MSFDSNSFGCDIAINASYGVILSLIIDLTANDALQVTRRSILHEFAVLRQNDYPRLLKLTNASRSTDSKLIFVFSAFNSSIPSFKVKNWSRRQFYQYFCEQIEFFFSLRLRQRK